MVRAHAVQPSYIALGAVFPTTLKKMATAPQGLARLAAYVRLMQHYPLVAIGGISEDLFPPYAPRAWARLPWCERWSMPPTRRRRARPDGAHESGVKQPLSLAGTAQCTIKRTLQVLFLLKARGFPACRTASLWHAIGSASAWDQLVAIGRLNHLHSGCARSLSFVQSGIGLAHGSIQCRSLLEAIGDANGDRTLQRSVQPRDANGLHLDGSARALGQCMTPAASPPG
jgi:hypothetical protein